ncbi:MAG TPA: hypothetical protein VFW45_15460 [Candidatus Polarisedimenticolia bacterium]|nr:hypothetical protein [Candidatus Polarisedimenticolia bacterium]
MIRGSSRAIRGCFHWAVIIGTTTVGTEVSDLLDRAFKLGYTAGSAPCLLVFWALSPSGTFRRETSRSIRFSRGKRSCSTGSRCSSPTAWAPLSEIS